MFIMNYKCFGTRTASLSLKHGANIYKLAGRPHTVYK